MMWPAFTGPKSGPIDNLTLLSSNTHYGLIWKGQITVNNTRLEVAIKMVILSSGFHYDFWKGRYSSSNAERFLTSTPDGPFPFTITKFSRRKAMSHTQFDNEHEHMSLLGKLSTPIYDTWIEASTPVHFGFIVSELCDCTAKDILLQRQSFSQTEYKLLHHLIERLHRRKYTHGDLKPSNIGVFLRNSRIVKCRFLDCQKVRYKQRHFEKYVQRDWKTFYNHIKKNKKDTQ